MILLHEPTPEERAADRERWLAERRSGVGSSDVAAILGVSPWATAWSVWADRMGIGSESSGAPMEWGTRMEGAVIDWCAARRGYVATRNSASVAHPERPWMRATPDALVGDDGLVEAKTARTAAEWGAECEITTYTDGHEEVVPAHYYLQCQWQLAVTGRQWCDLAVAVWPELRVYRLHRDDEVIRMVVERIGAWWQRHIVEGEAPPQDGTQAARSWWASQHPGDKAAKRPATSQEADTLAALASIRRQMRDLEAQAKPLEQAIREAIGDGYRIDAAPGLHAILTVATTTRRVAGLREIETTAPELAAQLAALGLITESVGRTLRITDKESK